jgi:TolB-like protein/Flp pilus assembly protein TadD
MGPAGSPRAGEGRQDVSPDLVRDQLARILRSRRFVEAPTLGRLLQHLVEHTLEGDSGQLKEYSLGLEVFNRGPSFDPQTDTIVRAHARRLRKRLDEYYAGEGQEDAILIALPKGHYSVVWQLAVPGGPPVPERVAVDGLPSLVVLPFANLTGDADHEYFADGLTDEIINALASLPGVHVVARTSAFQFKGRHEDIRRIGSTLGVEMALEGSVRRDGHSVRVAAQLIDARTGFQQWSKAYDRDLTSIFKLQDEVTHAIVDALWARLSARARGPVRSTVPASAEAHDCYLKGRYFWNRATPEDVAKAMKYLEQSLSLDNTYAAAHAALADAYVFLATIEAQAPGPLMEAARAAAQRALALQDLAEGHSAMGTVLGIGDWDWTGAEREFGKALELMPSFAHARAGYAVGCLAPLRRHEEAVAQMRQAVRLDPLSVFFRMMLGQLLVLAGKPEEALEELRQVLELDPAYQAGRIAQAWAHLGRSAHAEALDVLLQLPPSANEFPNFAGHLGYSYAKLGDRARAEGVLQALLERFPGEWVPGVDVAAIYSGLGNREMALHWIARARELRSFDVTFVLDDPRFVDFRADLPPVV